MFGCIASILLSPDIIQLRCKMQGKAGKYSFPRKSLHAIGSTPNPYEQAISIIGRTLTPFNKDNLIPCFGFGDAMTHDQYVFGFYPDQQKLNQGGVSPVRLPAELRLRFRYRFREVEIRLFRNRAEGGFRNFPEPKPKRTFRRFNGKPVPLQSSPPLDEASIACILHDLLDAIEYLHNEGKIHRDIKGLYFLRSTTTSCSIGAGL
ncbi:E3 ubiquitin-protein ligase RGLG1 [Morella rubra]|uniref:E3 ubiquitin-protein ligase RGLG1 n=1 Tax=Morella rubra TaxID=262757 RepID=A0A6A1VZW8_9ROSI|nr:E3 ubiquitin-protein ligase RGLG1 [Morella rubra]